MARQRRKKTKFASVRLDPETHAAALEVAKFTGRTLAGLIDYTLREFIDTHYPQAYENKALKHVFTVDPAANGE